MSTSLASTPAERWASAEAAYVAGDFASLRAHCAALEVSDDPELGRSARALKARVAADAAAWIVLGLALLVFIGVVGVYAT